MSQAIMIRAGSAAELTAILKADALVDLALRIADATVRSDVEIYGDWVQIGEDRFINTAVPAAGYEVDALKHVDRAMQYIAARGEASFPWQLHKHPKHAHLVRFEDKPVAGGC